MTPLPLSFRKIVSAEERSEFVAMLPDDWSEELEWWMSLHSGEPDLYGVYQENLLIGGGAVFRKSNPPESQSFEKECRLRLASDQPYIGFLWVSPGFRGMGVGQFWLGELMREDFSKPYWLTVEDPALISFYEKAGFKLVKKFKGDEGPEWLLSTQG
jgi:ribosomal protein S18 acetylase RimI-like enzyme